MAQLSIEELMERARKNEAIARKLFDIEIAIMNLGHSGELLETLIALIEARFNVDYVGLALIRAPHTAALVRSVSQSDTLKALCTQLDSVAFLEITKGARTPILANQKLDRFYPMIRSEGRAGCHSIAVLPLTINQRIVGALVLGSEQRDRYRPDKDSFFLHQLAVKASLCLDAALSREKIQFLATRDPLTHLRNRRELEEMLEQEITRSQRHQSPLALVFIDCDDFKQVNDTWGHDVGDLYLQHMATCLTTVVRKSDQVFRFAGDEFVVLLPEQDRAGGEQFIARFKQHLADHPLHIASARLQMKASAGLAVLAEMEHPSMREMLKQADIRLYEAKKHKHSEVPQLS